MKASATLLAVAVLAVGCAGADSENVAAVGSDSESDVDDADRRPDD